MKICVFSGSAQPYDSDITNAMENFALWAAKEGHTVVCGGMAFGGMKVIGDAVLASGGKLHCITPVEFESYEAEHSRPHPHMTRENTPNLHQRLERMVTISDAFVAFPGGLGTIHEIMQVWADNQAATYHNGGGRKPKPLILYDKAFFEGLMEQIEMASYYNYIKPDHVQLAVVVDKWPELNTKLNELKNYA